jgi:hypothetical protein
MEWFGGGFEHIHLDGLHRLCFPVYHAAHSFCRFPAENGLTAIRTDSRRNCFDTHWFAIDVKDFTDEFLPCLSFSADMTAKHCYLRRE